MPLINNKEMHWNGYLVDNLAGSIENFLLHLEESLGKRQISKVNWNRATVNMWWRKNSLCLDVFSNVDDTIASTVHVMDYGTSLFIGIAYGGSWMTDNYYKRMAASCFLEIIDRCVSEAIATTSIEVRQEAPTLTTIGKTGKFGG